MDVKPELFEPDSLNGQKIEKSHISEKNIMQDLDKPTEVRFEEGMATFFPDQNSHGRIETNPESERESKTQSFLTAKQIEESQDNISIKEEDITSETSSLDSKDEKNSANGIFDYSGLDSSSSMPMDAVGSGILEKFNNFIREQEARLSKVKEKVSTKESKT